MPGDDADTENVDLLRAYLANADAPCPKCGYNLRGVESAACPECGRALSLSVRITDLKLRWWLVAVIALAMSIGHWALDLCSLVFSLVFWGEGEDLASLGVYLLFLVLTALLIGISTGALVWCVVGGHQPCRRVCGIIPRPVLSGSVLAIVFSGAALIITEVIVKASHWRVRELVDAMLDCWWLGVVACVAGVLISMYVGRGASNRSQIQRASMACVAAAWLWLIAVPFAARLGTIVPFRHLSPYAGVLGPSQPLVSWFHFSLAISLLCVVVTVSAGAALIAVIRWRACWYRLPMRTQAVIACLCCMPCVALYLLELLLYLR